MTMADKPSLVYVDLYQVPKTSLLGRPTRRAQRWRWRALNGDNGRVMGVSSEAYTNEDDCRAAIVQLFGSFSNVYLRSDQHGNEKLRLSDNPTA